MRLQTLDDLDLDVSDLVTGIIEVRRTEVVEKVACAAVDLSVTE
jgi:hypothetical protein